MFGFGRKKKVQEVMERHKMFMTMVYFHYTNASYSFVLEKPTESQKVIVALFFDVLVSIFLGETEPQSTLDAVLAANINDDEPFFINGTHISTARKLAQVYRDEKALRVVAAAETLGNPTKANADVLSNLLKDKSLKWTADQFVN